MDLIHPSFPGAGGAMERPANVFGVGDVARQRRPVLALSAKSLLERISVMRANFMIRVSSLDEGSLPSYAYAQDIISVTLSTKVSFP